MPSPNQIKDYFEDSYYHIYNRGINFNHIFHNSRDYQTFLHHLKITLLPVDALDMLFIDLKNSNTSGRNNNVYEAKIRQLENAIMKEMQHKLAKNIDLLSYCLMPNHFHLLIYQRDKRAIEKLMRQLTSGYSSYYRRVYTYRGPLFESRYKANCFRYDPCLQALIAGRYIERNSFHLMNNLQKSNKHTLLNYPYSSLKYYGHGSITPKWVKTYRINKIFTRLKEKANGDIEKRIAKYDSYTDFVLTNEDFSLEKLKEFYKSQMF